MKKYQIYNGYDNIMADYPIIEANTGKEAIMKLIKEKNYPIKNIRRSKDNDVVFKAQGFYEKEGYKHQDGNAIWYAIDYKTN